MCCGHAIGMLYTCWARPERELVFPVPPKGYLEVCFTTWRLWVISLFLDLGFFTFSVPYYILDSSEGVVHAVPGSMGTIVHT